MPVVWGEIGIRLALGAQHPQVARLVLERSLFYVGLGICLSVGMALAAARFTGTLPVGVTGTDPLTFCALLLLFACVSLIASALPGRRAMRADPIEALRWE
jgi:ABC-type antimicrobial peptide transport system permease subunit